MFAQSESTVSNNFVSYFVVSLGLFVLFCVSSGHFLIVGGFGRCHLCLFDQSFTVIFSSLMQEAKHGEIISRNGFL